MSALRGEMVGILRNEIPKRKTSFWKADDALQTLLETAELAFPDKKVFGQLTPNNDNSISGTLGVDQEVVVFIINKPYMKN